MKKRIFLIVGIVLGLLVGFVVMNLPLPKMSIENAMLHGEIEQAKAWLRWEWLGLSPKDGMTRLEQLDRALLAYERSLDGTDNPLDKDIVLMLLDAGANVNYLRPGLDSLLDIATFHKQPDLVKELLKRGADPHMADHSVEGHGGGLPLITAIHRKDAELAKMLLDGGADVNCVNHGFQASALVESIQYDLPEITNILLERGADVNRAAENGATALSIANRKGNKELVKRLLAKGAKKEDLKGPEHPIEEILRNDDGRVEGE